MRLTKAERMAAMAVLGMTAAVVTSGVRLIRRHTRYVTQKAAAFFEAQEAAEAARRREMEEAARAEETADAQDYTQTGDAMNETGAGQHA